MRHFVFFLFVIASINSFGQTSEKGIGKLIWNGEVVVEKGYAEDIHVLVLKTDAGIDTIQMGSLIVKNGLDNRGKCSLEFDIGQVYSVIFLPDTATHEPLEFVIDTHVPEKFINHTFILSFYGMVKCCFVESYNAKRKKDIVAVKFDEKLNTFYQLKD